MAAFAIARAMATSSEVFLQLTILLSVAVTSHFASKRFHQPTIIGEIAIGVILGPSILGFILNGWSPPPPGAEGPFDPVLITIFAGLGAIFLLFLIGIETDVRAVYKRKNIYVALGGVIVPWVFGFLTAYFMVAPNVVIATFVGAILVATSTAIAAAILRELGMLQSEVASTIMGAVVVDDLLGLMVLSLAVGVSQGGLNVLGLVYLVAVAAAFILLAMYIGARYFARLVVWTQARGVRLGLKHAGFMMAMAVAFSTSFLSEAVGLTAVIGAFLAGTMFSATPLRRDFQEGVEFLGAVFTPVFFISLGLLVNVWAIKEPRLLWFGAVLLVVAFLTKLVGCSTVARWTGMSAEESMAVGYGMIPRGEVGLIIALIAEQAGVIGPDLFSVIVLVMVAVSVLPAPLLRRALLRLPEASRPAPEVPSGERPA